MKTLLELLGLLADRLTGTRRKGMRRRPRDVRRTLTTGLLAGAGMAVALVVYGLIRFTGDTPPVGAAPTSGATGSWASSAPPSPTPKRTARAAPTIGAPTVQATISTAPRRTGTPPPATQGVRKGASCSPEGAVAVTASGQRVTCQGPGRVRWRP